MSMSAEARRATAAERVERGTRQEHLDAFYHQRGPCCAGCDWWHSLSSLVGECHQSAMVGGIERWAAVGIENCSMPQKAGHVITNREHVCGQFKDEFDWSSLPIDYRKRVGELTKAARPAPTSNRSEKGERDA
jgi:hypothetical protein